MDRARWELRKGRQPGGCNPSVGAGDVLDITMRAIQSSLDGLSARQRIIAQNVANADTPGYLAGKVDFESSLRDAVANGVPEQTHVSTHTSIDPTNVNGNNVNIDDENISLVETGLRYQLATEAMNAKFRILRSSMQDK
jgi:flagellar basal-body rod protein FlgB